MPIGFLERGSGRREVVDYEPAFISLGQKAGAHRVEPDDACYGEEHGQHDGSERPPHDCRQGTTVCPRQSRLRSRLPLHVVMPERPSRHHRDDGDRECQR